MSAPLSLPTPPRSYRRERRSRLARRIAASAARAIGAGSIALAFGAVLCVAFASP